MYYINYFIKTCISYIFRYLPWVIIGVLFCSFDVHAQSYDLTLPRWDKNVFATTGQNWGYESITTGSYAGYNNVFKSPTITFPNAANIAYQMVTSNMYYSDDTYQIEFYLTGTIMQYVKSVSANDYICEIKKASDLSILVTCSNVKFNVYTYNGRDWNTFLVRAYYDMPDNVSTTSNFGIASKINISKSDIQEDIYNEITSSNTDNDKVTSTLNNVSIGDEGAITQLITLPISLFTNVLNAINGQCTSFNLGNLFGTNLSLPCINIENILGSNLWSIIDILFSGFSIYYISNKIKKIFEQLTNLREGDVLND